MLNYCSGSTDSNESGVFGGSGGLGKGFFSRLRGGVTLSGIDSSTMTEAILS